MKATCEKYLNDQFGGDADVVADIYAEYASSSRAKVSEAAAELAAGEWAALDRTAHTLKGNALAAGDGEVAQIGIELRQAVQLQDGERCATLIRSLERLLEELQPAVAVESFLERAKEAAVFKTKDDPRMARARAGRFRRRTSLDELPQP